MRAATRARPGSTRAVRPGSPRTSCSSRNSNRSPRTSDGSWSGCRSSPVSGIKRVVNGAISHSARRQSPGRARRRRARLLAGHREQHRHRPGPRLWEVPGAVDGARLGRGRHARPRSAAVRRVRGPGVHVRQGPSRVLGHVPADPAGRGTSGGPPGEEHAAVSAGSRPRAASSPRASAGSGRSGSRSTGATRTHSFRRNNVFEVVAAECRAVRERVGVLELPGFARFDVSGPGAEAFLDRRVRQPHVAPGWRHRARPRPDRPRSDRRRVHRHAPGRRSLHAAVRRRGPPARSRPPPLLGPSDDEPVAIADVTDGVDRPHRGRTACPGPARDADDGRPRQRRLPVADGPGDRRGRHPRASASRQLRRRAGLGTARAGGRGRRAVRRGVGGRRRVRDRRLRAVRREQPADGEGLSGLGRRTHQRGHPGRSRAGPLRQAGP